MTALIFNICDFIKCNTCDFIKCNTCDFIKCSAKGLLRREYFGVSSASRAAIGRMGGGGMACSPSRDKDPFPLQNKEPIPFTKQRTHSLYKTKNQFPVVPVPKCRPSHCCARALDYRHTQCKCDKARQLLQIRLLQTDQDSNSRIPMEFWSRRTAAARPLPCRPLLNLAHLFLRQHAYV